MLQNRKLFVRIAMAVFSVILLGTGYYVTSQSIVAEKAQYTGHEKHQVDLMFASKLTENFQTSAGDKDVIGAYFGKDIFEKIMTQKNCVGVRIYNARLDDGRQTYVVVGVDGNGRDLASGVLAEDAMPCPPFCGWPPSWLDGSSHGQQVAMAK